MGAYQGESGREWQRIHENRHMGETAFLYIRDNWMGLIMSGGMIAAAIGACKLFVG